MRVDGLARLHEDLVDDGIAVGHDAVFHLHGLQDDEGLTGRDAVPDDHLDRCHCPGDRSDGSEFAGVLTGPLAGSDDGEGVLPARHTDHDTTERVGGGLEPMHQAVQLDEQRIAGEHLVGSGIGGVGDRDSGSAQIGRVTRVGVGPARHGDLPRVRTDSVESQPSSLSLFVGTPGQSDEAWSAADVAPPRWHRIARYCAAEGVDRPVPQRREAVEMSECGGNENGSGRQSITGVRGQYSRVFVQERCRGVGREEGERGQDRQEHVPVGGHPTDGDILQCGDHFARGFLAVVAVGDDLRQHRIVEPRDGVAGRVAGVDESSEFTGHHELVETPDTGKEPVGRVLRVQPDLDGVPVDFQVFLIDVELLALRDQDLPAHQIGARDLLGHSVLDLEPGVHLQEVELLGVSVAGHQKLDRAGADIPDAFREGHRRAVHPLPSGCGGTGRGSLLDDLLMPSLYGALPVEQVHEVAPTVAEHLDLDVPRSGQVALQEHGVVAERRPGFPPGTGHSRHQVGRGLDHAHTLATATRGRLDHQRIADVLRLLGDLRVGLAAGQFSSRHQRHTCRRSGVLGFDLQGHGLDGLRRWSDPDQARGHHPAGELRVLRQEPVARMDRIGPDALSGRQDLVHVQIGFRGG